MWYCRRTACLVDNTARACSAFAKRRLQANVTLLERGEIFGYYTQTILITIIEGTIVLLLRAIFYPLCLVWQIKRIVFAWLANPGRENLTEIYGRCIDGATAAASLLMEAGRRHLLNPLLALATNLGLLLRYLLQSTAFALENIYDLTHQVLGQMQCLLTQVLLTLHHVFGHIRPAMQQACLPPYHETELPAMHTEHCLQFEKHNDVSDLLEEPDTELPSRPSSWEHEGLDPHDPHPSFSWPVTSTLPVLKLSPCRYPLGRQK